MNTNMIENYSVDTKEKLAAGKHHLIITTKIEKPFAPASVTINIDGKDAAACTVNRTVPAAFSANESFDVGRDLGAPVSLRYAKKAPFIFNGKISKVKVDLL
jgi:arylsulfatase